MNRAEFFIKTYRGSIIVFKYSLVISTCITLLMRVQDSELSMAIAGFVTVITLPAMFFLVLRFVSMVRDFYRFEHGNKPGFVEPNIWSVKLLPQSLVVSIGVLVPPVMVVSVIFGLEGHKEEHTTVLSVLLLVHLLGVWYFWVFEPFLKKAISGNQEKL